MNKYVDTISNILQSFAAELEKTPQGRRFWHDNPYRGDEVDKFIWHLDDRKFSQVRIAQSIAEVAMCMRDIVSIPRRSNTAMILGSVFTNPCITAGVGVNRRLACIRHFELLHEMRVSKTLSYSCSE